MHGVTHIVQQLVYLSHMYVTLTLRVYYLHVCFSWRIIIACLCSLSIQDDDGFYTGRVGEAFGLVPSNFLQQERKKSTREKHTEGTRKEDTEERVEKWYARPVMVVAK